VSPGARHVRGSHCRAWFGIIVNLIVCAYEVVALVRMTNYLWPSVTDDPWYTFEGSPVNLLTLSLGLALVATISALHWFGVKLSSTFTKIVTTTLMVLVSIGVVMAFTLGDFHNFSPAFDKPVVTGVIAVATMLPFSLAGWESIAKGAEEARSQETSGKAVPIAWGAGLTAYIFTVIATGLVMPWKDGANEAIPFATGLNDLAGGEWAGDLLIVTAIIGVVGVYNALFYSLTRQMFGMARRGMLPAWMADVHPKHKSPHKVIAFLTVLLLAAPFLGKGFMLSYVDAASFAYIVLWGATFLSVVALRRRYTGTSAEFSSVGGRPMEYLGYTSIAFMLCAMLIPSSPGHLIWPEEHLILLGLVALGGLLYGLRRWDHTPSPSGPDQPVPAREEAELPPQSTPVA
jgi:amino acid transporter